MCDAAYFWACVVDESYRDPKAAAVFCAAGGIALLMVLAAIVGIGNVLSKYTRD